MPFLAPIKAFATSVTGAIILVLVAALVVQTVRIEGFKFWPFTFHGYKAKYETALDKLKAEREAARKAGEEQKATTERNIIVYGDRVVNGGKVAERIEQAPLPGDCRTPEAVRSADL